MRFYAIKNMYMNGIHSGIQSGHVMGELFNKYGNSRDNAIGARANRANITALHDMLWDWNINHRTWIVLDGGYASNLRSIIEVFKKYEDEFPWADFHEDEDALDGALTAIGIILPKWIYDCQRRQADQGLFEYVYREAVPCGAPGTYMYLQETVHTFESKYFDLIHAVKQCKFAT